MGGVQQRANGRVLGLETSNANGPSNPTLDRPSRQQHAQLQTPLKLIIHPTLQRLPENSGQDRPPTHLPVRQGLRAHPGEKQLRELCERED